MLFEPDQLIALDVKEVPNDERYGLLQGNKIFFDSICGKYVFNLEAVRNKFRLCSEEFETMWQWLHNVVLAKRRTFNAKKRRQALVCMNNN